jgi:hypothetical protein
VLENVPIAIYDFDIVVGRETNIPLGSAFVDEVGDSIPGFGMTPASPGCSGSYQQKIKRY